MIVYNHTCAYSACVESVALLLPAIICKIGVPIFFMISGALLLGKNESLKDIFRKRVLRIAIALIAISIIAYTFNVIRSGDIRSFSAVEFINQFRYCGIDSSYWYLYTYIGLLCCLPLMRPMVQHMSLNTFGYFTLANFLLNGIIPFVNTFVNITYAESLNFPMIINNVWMMTAGYFIEHKFSCYRLKHQLLISLLVAMIAVFAPYMLTAAQFSLITSQQIYNAISYMSFMIAPCVYILVRSCCLKMQINAGRPSEISEVGRCVFGMYLIQYIILRITDPICWDLMNYIGVFFALVIQTLLIAVIGFVITYVLKKIPAVRQIL